MRIYIIGSTGQLGSDLSEVLSSEHSVEGGGRDTFDITETEQFIEYVKGNYDIVINTAAENNLKYCEENPQRAELINGDIPGRITDRLSGTGTRFIHFSTDYVFDGNKTSPYTERDTPNPLNTYARTKYQGEVNVLSANPDALILRVSGLYGRHKSRTKGYDFVSKVINKALSGEILKIVDDQILTPTHTLAVARQTALIIDSDLSGIIHCTDHGSVSWYEFADEALSIAGIKADIEPINTPQGSIIRPMYSVLENTRLKNAGIDNMKYWKDSLKEYFSLI